MRLNRGMEILIALLVIGALALLAFGLMAGGFIAASSKAQRRSKQDAPKTLDAAFDGREDVVFKITGTSLGFDEVVLGAKARGYRLASQSDDDRWGTKTLIFEKRKPQRLRPPARERGSA